MSTVIDIVFFFSLFSFVFLVGLYTIAIAHAFDNGYYEYRASQIILELLSRRSVDEFQTLSESERISIGQTWAHAVQRVEKLDEAPLGRDGPLFLACLIAGEDEQVQAASRSIWKRGKELNEACLEAVESTLPLVEGQPVIIAVRRVQRTIARQHWMLWLAGLRENYAKVVSGSARYSASVVLGAASLIVLLFVSKVIQPQGVGVAGELVALVGTLALLMSLGLSPAIVAIQAFRKVSNERRDGLPDTRAERRRELRNRRLVLRLLPVTLLVGFIMTYLGPMPFPVLLPTSSVEPGSPLSRVGALAFALGIGYYVLRPLAREAKFALSPNAVYMVGPVRLYVHQSDGSAELPVAVPISVRLSSLANVALLGPVMTLIAYVALALAASPDGVPKDLSGRGPVKFLLIGAGIFLIVVWPLLSLAGGIAATVERRRRRRGYVEMGISVPTRTPPWTVWTVASVSLVLVAWGICLVAPSGQDDGVGSAVEWMRIYPLWTLAAVLLTLAWVVGSIVLAVWTVVQRRRMRRDESDMATRAHLFLLTAETQEDGSPPLLAHGEFERSHASAPGSNEQDDTRHREKTLATPSDKPVGEAEAP